MGKVKVYRTQSGDTWDLISYKLFGTEGYYAELIRANPKLIDIAIFSSNIPVIIPELDITENDLETDESIPPWKR